MARPWRIQYPGAIYHITVRGNNRQEIFLEDSDRTYFLRLLGKVCEQYHFEIFAFCLMSNHFHLFLRSAEANLSAGMHWLNTSFTVYFNWRHGRSGHLFQGRYHSVLVADQEYFLHLSMYLHLNPVRAGIAENPGDYGWSSFRDYLAAKPRFPWLNRDQVLAHYSRSRDQLSRARNYHKECLALIGKEPTFLEQLKQGAVLGPAKVVEELLKKYRPSGQFKTVPSFSKTAREMIDLKRELEKVADIFGVKVEELRRKRKNFPARLAAYYHLTENCAMTTGEAGKALGVCNSAVSRGA